MAVDKKTAAFYANYQPTVEDLAAIQEYFHECRLVQEKIRRERETAETETRDETPRAYIPVWTREASFASKVAALLEGV